jgi:4-hydroxy-tetrahydrodipicolinate synthase
MTPAPGHHVVLVTPFTADESVDAQSLATLVERSARAGAVGVLVLGVLGEADRLTDAERELVLAATLAAARESALEVTVGITHASARVVARRAADAAEAGADAVMVSPPPGTNAGPALAKLFAGAAASGVPVVAQDLPQSSGVKMSVAFLAQLAHADQPIAAVKLEEPPTPAKTAALHAAAPSVAIFGGLGAAMLPAELEAGAVGSMTGFAFPELLVEINAAHRDGEPERARELHRRALELIQFEGQPVVGLALRKELLRRRGMIADATLRAPAPTLDPFTLAGLELALAQGEEVLAHG